VRRFLQENLADWDDKLIWLMTMTTVGALIGMVLEKLAHGG
jgi:hypothetical protein